MLGLTFTLLSGWICLDFTFGVLSAYFLGVCCCVDFLRLGFFGKFWCLLMKIRRRKCRKRYLGKKGVYEYERLSLDFPAKFRDAVEPFLDQDLDIDVKREGNDKLVVILTPRENVSVARKALTKTRSL